MKKKIFSKNLPKKSVLISIWFAVILLIFTSVLLYKFNIKDYPTETNQAYQHDSLFQYLKTVNNSYKNIDKKEITKISAIINDALLYNDSTLLCFSYYCKGKAFREMEQMDSAFLCYEMALGIAEGLSDDLKIANIKLALGNYYTDVDNYLQAIQCFLDACRIYEKTNSSSISSVYNGLGIVYVSLEDFEHAINYYKKALDYYEQSKDELNIAGISMNLAGCYIEINDYNRALSLLKRSERILIKLNDSIRLSNCYSNIGLLYNAQNMTDSALKYHNISLLIAENINNERLTGAAMQNIGLLFQKAGKKKQARSYFEDALKMFAKTKFTRGEISSSLSLSDLFRDEGDWEQAYQYYISYIGKRDSMMNAKMRNEIFEYQWKYDEQKRKLQISTLNQALTVKKHQTQVLIIAVVFIIVLACFIGFSLRRSVKIHKIKNALLFHQIEAKQKSTELQELKHKNELEAKNKELTTMSLQLLTQNEVFENLRSKTEKLYEEKSIDNNALRILTQLIEDNSDREKNWTQFKILFEKVHIGFFHNLKTKYPSLTENEIRICAYLKINLQAKEIAVMLNVSPATIFTNRHHIRRKLNLNKDEKLEDYLRNI